jgi:hypothetical protein
LPTRRTLLIEHHNVDPFVGKHTGSRQPGRPCTDDGNLAIL